MRVSPAFNAIAGPRLYHTLTLGETSGLANPFGGSKRGVFDIPVKKAWMKKNKDKQKTQGKEKDLGFIRHVFFEASFHSSEFPKITRPADKGKLFNSVKSIRLRFDPYQKETNGIEILARFTRIEKLVLVGSSQSPGVPHQLLPSTCSKRVILINRQLRVYPPTQYATGPGFPRGRAPHLKNEVYVFLDRDAVSPLGGFDLVLDSWVRATAVLDSSYGKLPRIVIVVNPPLIRFQGHAEQTLEDCFMQLIAARKRERAASNVDTGKASSNDVPKQDPTFKFISMREYLREYDWAGEFTDEEVRPWLEEEEAERAAAQLEEEAIEGDTVE